jgi:hypothetical protein
MGSLPLTTLLLVQHVYGKPTPRTTYPSIFHPRYYEYNYGHDALTPVQIAITVVFIVTAFVLLGCCCYTCRRRQARTKLYPHGTQAPLEQRRDQHDGRAAVYRPDQVNDMELPAYTAQATDGERVIVPKAVAHTYQ